MGLNKFIFEDIGLGMNNVSDLYELRPGESPDLINVVPQSGGQILKRRQGSISFNSTMAAIAPIDTLYEWPAKDLIVAAQVDYIRSTPRTAASAWTTRFTGAGVDYPTPWVFELGKNGAGTEILWMVNGASTPQAWDGVSAATGAWAPNAPPAGVTWIKLWKNRMVAGGNPAFPERLYYSPVGDPAGVYQTIDIRSSYDDADVITSAELIGDNLLVFKENSTWLIYDINTFANRRLGYPGCPHLGLSANLNGVVYFINVDGLWVCDGISDPTPVDMKVDLSPTLFNTTTFFTQLIADPREQRLLWLKSFVNGDAQEGLWLYYPPRTINNPRKEGTWWKEVFFSNLISTILVCKTRPLIGAALDYSIMAANGSADLSLIFDPTVLTDDGTGPQSATWKSGIIPLADMEKIERVRRLNLRGTPSFKATLSAPGATDFVSTVTTVDSSGYVMLRPELRGREFQLKVENSGAGTFELRDVELIFRGGKEHVK